MLKTILGVTLGALFFCTPAAALTCASYSYTFSNGSIADATQVNSNFNSILSCANTLLAPLASPHFSGNVGIDNNSPGALLHIGPSTTITDTTAFRISGTFASSAAALDFVRIAPTYQIGFNGAAAVFRFAPVIDPQVAFTSNLSALTNNFTIGGSSSNSITTMSGATYGMLTSGTWTGTITNLHDILVNDTSLTSGGAVTNHQALLINAQSAATNSAGVVIAKPTSSGKNAGIIIGQTANPTGNFGIYDATAYNDYFAGKVGIGTTAPAVTLAVVGDIRTGTTGTNGCVQNFAGTALTGTCSSDAALKTVTGPVANILDRFAKLTLVNFRWNRVAAGIYHNSTTARNTGFIAQAVERQFPELVTVDEHGYRQVDYSTLSLYGLEATKELKAVTDQQATEIARLKARLADGDKRFERIESQLAALEISKKSARLDGGRKLPTKSLTYASAGH